MEEEDSSEEGWEGETIRELAKMGEGESLPNSESDYLSRVRTHRSAFQAKEQLSLRSQRAGRVSQEE